MRAETKEAIYMLLDLLDSLAKTSKNHPRFIKIDQDLLKDIKNELFSLLSQSKNYPQSDSKTELIGILPSAFMDKNKFPTNEDIARLARSSLNLLISRWDKRSREELVGIVIAEIALKNEIELEKFFEAWKEFTNVNKPYVLNENDNDFVSVWLDFFNHYKRM